MRPEKRPSIIRIIFTNYVTFISVAIPLFLWTYFLFDHFSGDRLTAPDLVNLSAFTFIGILIAFWKIFTISSTINYGQETTATIHSSIFFRSRGRVQFVYTYQGEKYMTQNIVLKNKRTGKVATGSQVSIFLNPNNPKKAVIKEFYTSDGN